MLVIPKWGRGDGQMPKVCLMNQVHKTRGRRPDGSTDKDIFYQALITRVQLLRPVW